MKAPHNKIYQTWACECGQMNYFSTKECVCCGTPVEDGWDLYDMSFAIPSAQSRNPEAKPKVTGFEEFERVGCYSPPHSDDPFYVNMTL